MALSFVLGVFSYVKASRSHDKDGSGDRMRKPGPQKGEQCCTGLSRATAGGHRERVGSAPLGAERSRSVRGHGHCQGALAGAGSQDGAQPLLQTQWCSSRVRGQQGAHLSTWSMGEGSSRAGRILHSPLFTAVHAHGARGRRLLLSVYLLPLFFSSISLASLTVVLPSSQLLVL